MREYRGFFSKQREASEAPVCFAFYASASEVMNWTVINRSAEVKDGIQRILRKSRVQAIARFFKSNPKNVIPNNILVAFSPGSVTLEEEETLDQAGGKVCLGKIVFSDETKGLLVDGQHRLYGMSKFEDEDVPVLVVAMLNIDLEEQAFQFIVVNNKAVRVPTTNVKSIVADIEETSLIPRLMAAGVKYGRHSPLIKELNDLDSSPFKGLVDWEYNREGTRLVPVTALEQCLKYLQSAFQSLDDDEDSLFEIFCAIWRTVKNTYSEQWGGTEFVLMKKVSINALNQSLVDGLKRAYEWGHVNVYDVEEVQKQLELIVQKLPVEFWIRNWNIKIQDNANVREIIKKDISRVLQNKNSGEARWDEGLTLFDSKMADDYDECIQDLNDN